MTTGRPKRKVPAYRMTVTLDQPDAELLEAHGHQIGKASATVAALIIHEALQAARNDDGAVTSEGVANVIRLLRGDDDRSPLEPRWEWPLDALLADTRWWQRWLPSLNELLGRGLQAEKVRSGFGKGGHASVRDRRGYSDLMEFLLPAIEGVSWRSMEYPDVAAPSDPDGCLRFVWEATIRHVATALDALEHVSATGTDGATRILVQEQITGSWLRTLQSITGEDKPNAAPKARLVG